MMNTICKNEAMLNKNFCYLLLLLLLALPLPSSALCVGCTCTASATGVVFGTYNPFGSNVDATGNVHLQCNGILTLGTVDYSIALNKGIYGTGFEPRQMGLAANRLNYNLYTSNGYGTIWGDGSGVTQVVSDSITIPPLGSNSVDHTIYGRLPGSQTSAAVGSYSDTITVTVTYN
jgi:spore coat protein U-like protein